MRLPALALVDIETTGSRVTRDCITEIAVWIIEENKVTKKWQTFVRSEQKIPEYIQRLTGITQKMVENAPSFAEIAPTLSELLQDKIFVAHNARFDYGFIKQAYARVEMDFNPKILCTVKLSRKLFPEEKSHKMDSLVARYQLKTALRHRASGDVDLIWQFLKYCDKTFSEEQLAQALNSILAKPSLPSHLETDIQSIPNVPGVYLFYEDLTSIPLYIGKSISLRKRIMSHFTNDVHHAKEMNICSRTKHIEWIPTTGEFGALLLESKLIKEKMPVYNRKLRRVKSVFSFQTDEINSYSTIRIVQASEKEAISINNLYGAFRSKRHAEKALRQLIESNMLCAKLCHLDHSQRSCFGYQLKKCYGACIQSESSEKYNLRVKMALAHYKNKIWPYKGPIGIKEHCPIQGKSQIHIIDQWHYLGTANNESDIFEIVNSPQPCDQTVDDTKYIQAFVFKNKNIITF